jgi:hypothetical protein
MPFSQNPLSVRQEKQLEKLELEIRQLEADLLDVEQKINAFTQLVRSRLASQIRLLNELTDLYKAQKEAKKEKRLDQKRRGKNYRPPTQILARQATLSLRPVTSDELKRLYKEAIVRVHPDKYAADDEQTSLRATEVTTELITLYQAGELDALRDYHEYILSGNAMAYVPFSRNTSPDPQSLLDFLTKKRDELRQRLTEMKESRLYEVLVTYEEPARFIEELRQAYAERIETFRKRTRRKS